MKPPRTATSPAAGQRRRPARARARRSPSMSGERRRVLGVGDEHRARIDPAAGDAASANAAATIRLLAISPIGERSASRERGETSRSTDSACTRPPSSSNSRRDLSRARRAPRSARHRARRDRAVPLEQRRRRPRAPCRLAVFGEARRCDEPSVTPASAETTTTGGRCAAAGAAVDRIATDDVDRSRRHRVSVGDRRCRRTSSTALASQQPLAVHQLGVENRRAGGAADGVVAERDELVVEHGQRRAGRR